MVLKGVGQTSFSSQVRTVTFKDVPASYKPGIPFQGKVADPVRSGPIRSAFYPPLARAEFKSVSSPGENGGPGQQTGPRRARVRVRGRLQQPDADDRRQGNGGVFLRHGVVEQHGDAEGGSPPPRRSAAPRGVQGATEISVCRQARSRKTEEREPYEPNLRRPEYRSASHHAAAFYSKSRSFLKVTQGNGKLPCGKEASVRVHYIIRGEELREGQEVLDHFYLVRLWRRRRLLHAAQTDPPVCLVSAGDVQRKNRSARSRPGGC